MKQTTRTLTDQELANMSGAGPKVFKPGFAKMPLALTKLNAKYERLSRESA